MGCDECYYADYCEVLPENMTCKEVEKFVEAAQPEERESYND